MNVGTAPTAELRFFGITYTESIPTRASSGKNSIVRSILQLDKDMRCHNAGSQTQLFLRIIG